MNGRSGSVTLATSSPRIRTVSPTSTSRSAADRVLIMTAPGSVGQIPSVAVRWRQAESRNARRARNGCPPIADVSTVSVSAPPTGGSRWALERGAAGQQLVARRPSPRRCSRAGAPPLRGLRSAPAARSRSPAPRGARRYSTDCCAARLYAGASTVAAVATVASRSTTSDRPARYRIPRSTTVQPATVILPMVSSCPAYGSTAGPQAGTSARHPRTFDPPLSSDGSPRLLSANPCQSPAVDRSGLIQAEQQLLGGRVRIEPPRRDLRREGGQRVPARRVPIRSRSGPSAISSTSTAARCSRRRSSWPCSDSQARCLAIAAMTVVDALAADRDRADDLGTPLTGSALAQRDHALGCPGAWRRRRRGRPCSPRRRRRPRGCRP